MFRKGEEGLGALFALRLRFRYSVFPVLAPAQQICFRFRSIRQFISGVGGEPNRFAFAFAQYASSLPVLAASPTDLLSLSLNTPVNCRCWQRAQQICFRFRSIRQLIAGV